MKLVEEAKVIKRVKNNSDMISFTFDDGPNPTYTPLLLDILKENNVKSTFFLLGKCVAAYPELVRRIADEGHEIGNHTYEHLDLTEESNSVIRMEIEKTESLLFSITGRRPKLLRSPYGVYNSSVRRITKELGYEFCHWTCSLGIEDWKLPGVDRLVELLLTAKPGDIILLHDAGGNREQTMEAVAKVLPLLTRKYNMVPLGEMLLHEDE